MALNINGFSKELRKFWEALEQIWAIFLSGIANFLALKWVDFCSGWGNSGEITRAEFSQVLGRFWEDFDFRCFCEGFGNVLVRFLNNFGNGFRLILGRI